MAALMKNEENVNDMEQREMFYSQRYFLIIT